ncbi:MAG: hypothetical protein AAF682_28495 [Planctomycetota bacterium]
MRVIDDPDRPLQTLRRRTARADKLSIGLSCAVVACLVSAWITVRPVLGLGLAVLAVAGARWLAARRSRRESAASPEAEGAEGEGGPDRARVR